MCITLRPLLYILIPCSVSALVLVQGYHLHRLPEFILLGVPAYLLTQSVVLLSKSGRDANWRIPILLGDASYSLYLTHPFVISAFKRLVGTRIPAFAPDHFPGMLANLILASLAGIAVHLAIDRPVYRYLSRRFARKPAAKLQPQT